MAGDAFRVVGPARLSGSVAVRGAKNSALKLMAASLLAPGKNTLLNVPDIADVEIMSELLERLGCTVSHDRSNHSLTCLAQRRDPPSPALRKRG